jgi:hypothetical protein
MPSEAEVEAAARSLAMTVVSGSRETNPDAPRPGDGKPRWMNWQYIARAALEAAERVRFQEATAPSPTMPLAHPDIGN